MAVFEYEAIGPGGQKKRSTIEAGSQQEAIKQLRSRGLKPTKIRESKKGPAAAGGAKKQKKGLKIFGGRVTQTEMVQFTQQLATLQDAGLPIVRSLKILADQMGFLKAHWPRNSPLHKRITGEFMRVTTSR